MTVAKSLSFSVSLYSGLPRLELATHWQPRPKLSECSVTECAPARSVNHDVRRRAINLVTSAYENIRVIALESTVKIFGIKVKDDSGTASVPVET